jgi:ubiquinone/menaquinone biosynthesis C-methylase UbiE
MENINFIKDYWDSQANKYKESHWASWGDKQMIDLEIDIVSNNIVDNNYVLDVGCANGYSTMRQLENNKNIKIVGIDFSEGMIKEANIKYNNKSATFLVGDICKIDYDDNIFDVSYTTRTLINLPNWELQKKGINELLRVTKRGGKVLLLEAFWEPLVRLNSIRNILNLKSLKEHDFNRYIKEEFLENFLIDKKLEFKRIDFSSIYYLGSRVLRELVTDEKEYEGYSNPINKIFYEIEKEYSGGNIGIQQAYIINN